MKFIYFILSMFTFIAHPVEGNSQQTYECCYQEEISDEEFAVLFEGANEGQKKVEEVKIQPFAFLIKDSDQQIKGGIKGMSFHDYLSVEILWVASELRHQGWGARLMRKAEQLGRERNCLFVTLTTGTTEALSFYQKCGYEIEYSKPGYTSNSRIFMLKKNLNEF